MSRVLSPNLNSLSLRQVHVVAGNALEGGMELGEIPQWSIYTLLGRSMWVRTEYIVHDLGGIDASPADCVGDEKTLVSRESVDQWIRSPQN